MNKKKIISLLLTLICFVFISGCQSKSNKKNVELFIFKPESVKIFEKLAKDYEKLHPDINIEVSAPGDAYAVLKTRIVKGKIPDLIGLGGEQYYVEYAKSGIFEDLTNDPMMKSINPAYLESVKKLEHSENIHALPFVANVSGVLYNKDLFEAEGLTIPQTWNELIALCQKLKSENKLPFYLGYKDDWTIMQAFNPLAANLMDDQAFNFTTNQYKKYNDQYSDVLAKLKTLIDYSQGDVFSYNYNDATIAFAKGESYMYLQGNWAIPMILQTNPSLNLDMFPFPAEDEKGSPSVSGIDIVFSIAKKSKYSKEAKDFLKYLISKDAYQTYIDDQFAISTLKGNTSYASQLQGVSQNLQDGNLKLSPQYLFPTEVGLNALIQTYLINNNEPAFIKELNHRLAIINP